MGRPHLTPPDHTPHDAFMREALALADEAALLGEVPVGAVVVRDGAVVGRGHNRREIDHDPTAHAELLAIRDAAFRLGSWRLDGCRVYVTLEPCPMCAGAMVLSRIDACIYGCADPKGGFLGTLADLSRFSGLNHSFAVVPGVLADEATDRLQRFFRSLRATPKKRDGA
jgi:tRNA(adenine34) deaminase